MFASYEFPSLKSLACKAFYRLITSAATELINNNNNSPSDASVEVDFITDDLIDHIKRVVPKSLHTALALLFFNSMYKILSNRVDTGFVSSLVRRIFYVIRNLHIQVIDFRDVNPLCWINLMTNLVHMTSLTHLKIDTDFQAGVPAKLDDHSFDKLVHLKSFTLKLYCTDKIIENIAYKCKQLKHLNVEYSEKVTDNCVCHFAAMQNLQHVHVERTRITSSGCAIILLFRTNLRNAGPSMSVGSIVEKFVSDQILHRKLSIMDVRNHGVTTRHLRLIQEYCPDLKYLDVQCKGARFGDLHFPGLRDLAVSRVKFYTDGFDEFLGRVGAKLKVLYLKHVSELDRNAVLIIGARCPDLEKLILYRCSHAETTRGRGWRPENAFSKVKYLELISVNKEALVLLLSNCRALETLLVVNLKWELGDDTMVAILENNPMPALRQAYVHGIRIPSDQLFEEWALRCPRLVHMGSLNRYDDFAFESVRVLDETKFPRVQHVAQYGFPERRTRYQVSGLFPNVSRK